MCGIAGIVDMAGRPVAPLLLRRLCDALRHRGPDDEGYYLDGHVALGQRRLAILDLVSGRQPMSNEDGTVWIVFNGEIYNFRELRQQLEGLGHRFATRSDTEVIVHAYEQYGLDAVGRLRGMFAFALWDGRARTLVLARDRVGKKPLFFAEVDHQLVFASELQALVQHPGVMRELDWTALDDYLTYGYIPAPKTIFRGVYKLAPAHYLTLKLGDSGAGTRKLGVERYWRLAYRPKLRVGEEEAAEGLLEVLVEAVQLRLIADVPLGALLSGGIDSSVIVALMSHLSDRPVKTFSIGFDEEEFNELAYARLVAERYATEHQEFVVRPSALDILPTLVQHYGEPYADSSAVPTYYLARLTRDHVKVALNGDGGDECFAGYERYLGGVMADRYQRVPAAARRFAIEPLSRLLPAATRHRGRLGQATRFLRVANLPPPQRYLRWIGCFPTEQKATLYTPEFREQLIDYDAPAWLLRMWEQVGHDDLDPVDTMLAVDIESYLPYDLLVKMDIATMANSLEARSPFLDHKVMEFCARLPSGYKLRGMRLKYLLKKVGARLLPAKTSHRRKMGFGVPVGYWMRGELRSWVEDVLLSPRALKRGYFQPEALRQVVWAHLDGRRDHSRELWSLLWLEMWHRQFLD
jgi:asparagine synthase (glutamine-hydrolysing)